MLSVKMRPAVASERKSLEGLQWRASLKNPGDSEALLANRDAIELPVGQIEGGGVFVAEVAEAVVGFAAILPREDGDSELDALFVEPECGSAALAVHWLSIAAVQQRLRQRNRSTSSAIPTPKAFIVRAGSRSLARRPRASALVC
jgi:hypothetical protein